MCRVLIPHVSLQIRISAIEPDWIIGDPASGAVVVPAVEVVLLVGGFVEGTGSEAEEGVDGVGAKGVTAGVEILLQGDLAERIVLRVFAQVAAGVD